MTSKKLPKAKLSAISYLKSFGESIVESYTGSKPAPVVFPPPSWELDDKTHKTSPEPSELPSEPPITLARRIGALIDSLPTLPSTVTASSSSHAPPVKDEGKQGSPVPPDLDKDLIRMLGSEEIMNGESTNNKKSNQKGKNTPQQTRNIWNILASLKKSNDITSETPSPSAVEEEDGGVMMYAPLEPTNDSKLELAESETLLEYVDDPVPQASTSTPKSDERVEGSKDASTNTTLPTPDARKNKEKHIWVPSTTDLSILVTWWGYRLYLPPPVMNKLSGMSLKTSARAAMITTALKWILDKIPLMIIPVQFRPAVKMLKTLSPIVSYVGVFIAWSWDRIKSLDEGNGVVLTATWLLPVALLPMSWDAGDIYGPRQQEKDAPPSGNINTTDDKSATKSSNGAKGKQKQPKKKSIFPW